MISTEGLFLRSGSPQNVYLLPQHPNFDLKRCPRPKQICDHPNNEPEKISHPARASPDSRSTASQIEFAIGTTANMGDSPTLMMNAPVPATRKARREQLRRSADNLSQTRQSTGACFPRTPTADDRIAGQLSRVRKSIAVIRVRRST
jgi:hypothetical protein